MAFRESIDCVVLLPNIGSISESFVLSTDDLMLEGRCREFSIFKERCSRFKFICFRSLRTRNIHQPTTLLVSKESDFADITSAEAKSFYLFVTHLFESGINVIFTCDKIEGEDLLVLSTRGVILVSPVFVAYCYHQLSFYIYIL